MRERIKGIDQMAETFKIDDKMLEISIKFNNLEHINIIKTQFSVIKEKLKSEKAEWATLVMHIHAPNENAIEALLQFIPISAKERLIEIALEKYKNAIPLALTSLAKSQGLTISEKNVKVNASASQRREHDGLDFNKLPSLQEGESLEETYFNYLIEHLYGKEWDGQWDCDFEIDTDKNVIKFCTKHRWLFSDYLELSWDQFIDGIFSINNGKLCYDDQPLTMDEAMQPLIEAAQIELKEIRKRYQKGSNI